MRSQKVQLRFSKDLLEKVDMAAKAGFQSRSEFIRETLALRLNGQYVTKARQAEDEFDDMLKELLPDEHPLKD